MESVQSKQAPVKDGSSKASAVSGVNKPGRKFGLTGQRQVSPGNGSSGADGQHRFSVREEPRNSWMYSLSEQEMEVLEIYPRYAPSSFRHIKKKNVDFLFSVISHSSRAFRVPPSRDEDAIK